MRHRTTESVNTALAERSPRQRSVVLFVSIYLVAAAANTLAQADGKQMSMQDAVEAAEKYQRDMGVDPSQRRITITSDMRQLKILSPDDVEALRGVVHSRGYWIVYHSVDHRITPNIRGQAVVLVFDSTTRKLVHTLVK